MSSQSLDIVLNAIDRTGPAVNSAIGNLNKFDSAVSSVGSSGDSGGGGFISGIVGSLFSLPGAFTAAAVAAGAFGVAMATNVGGIRDTVLDFASGVATSIGSVFESISTSVGGTIKSIADGTFDWASLFKSVVTGIVTGFAVIEYTFKNFGQVADLIWTGAKLGVVTFGNEVEYIFTEVIPAYLTWFADNWRDIFQTIWDFTKTVVANLYENLVDFFANVFTLLSGGDADFKWKGLTDGFESSIKELPKIIEREIGPVEQALQDQFDDLGKKVGDGMGENIAKRVAQVPDIMKGISSFTSSIGDFFKGDKLGNFLSDLLGLGDDKPKEAKFQLPGLRNERFTTGVTASAESPEVKATNMVATILKDGLAALGIKLPGIIKEGVKVGIETAKTGNVAGFKL